MKNRVFALLLVLALILPVFTACEKSAQDEATLPLESESSKSDESKSTALQTVLKEAGKDSYFALVTPDSKDLYEAFEEEEAQEIPTEVDDKLEMTEKVFLLVTADTVDLRLERVEYKPEFDFFEKSEELARVSGKRGDLFSLRISLPEGQPNMRIVAKKLDSFRLASWPCAYMGKGDERALYVNADDVYAGMDTSSSIAYLSVAAVTAAIIDRNTPEIPEEIVPAKIMWTDTKYWYTVAHALTMIVDDSRGSYTWEKTQLPCHIIHDCGKAIFPDLAHPELNDIYFEWPDEDPDSGQNYGCQSCTMIPYDYGNLISYKVLRVGSEADGEAYVELTIESEATLEKPLTYRVNWKENMVQDLGTPFPYHITNIKLVKNP